MGELDLDVKRESSFTKIRRLEKMGVGRFIDFIAKKLEKNPSNDFSFSFFFCEIGVI